MERDSKNFSTQSWGGRRHIGQGPAQRRDARLMLDRGSGRTQAAQGDGRRIYTRAGIIEAERQGRLLE
jgi:hypothetical protein